MDARSSDTVPIYTAPKGQPFVNVAFQRGQKSGGMPGFNPADAVCSTLLRIFTNSDEITKTYKANAFTKPGMPKAKTTTRGRGKSTPITFILVPETSALTRNGW
jgi:hypothetical protein